MNEFYPANDEGVSTLAPTRRRVGHEVELQGNNNANLCHEFHTELRDAELIPPPDRWGLLHQPHCCCEASNDYPLHAHLDDSSTGGEFLVGGSDGVLYGSDRYHEAIDMICSLADAHRTVKVGTEVGSHVHISHQGLKAEAHNRMVRNYLAVEDDLLRLAVGEDTTFRDNGHVQARLNTRGDLNSTVPVSLWGNTIITQRGGKSTYEFRIWNASLVPQTLITNAGVCVGLADASIDGLEAENDSLVEFLYDYATDDVLADIEARLSRDDIQIPLRQGTQ